jgi:murein DD-endopeptidase MepM/ murein hydrolase activator NlpD
MLWVAPFQAVLAEDRVTVAVADGFDYPVRKPDGVGAYMARGYRSHSHLGEDWNTAPGDGDIGEPVYSVAKGVVVLARDVRLGWGNVVIVRHAFFEKGELRAVDSLYGHLHDVSVREGQLVGRGDPVGTIGNCRGRYSAHLHFEMRKNLEIGMNRAHYARDLSNYFDPVEFISERRNLRGGPSSAKVAINTFKIPDGAADTAGSLRFASKGPAAGERIRVIARRGSFKVNRYEDIDF